MEYILILVNGHEIEQTMGYSVGEGNVLCCKQWSCRLGNDLATEQLEYILKYDSVI